jgi:hypothetical protein
MCPCFGNDVFGEIPVPITLALQMGSDAEKEMVMMQSILCPTDPLSKNDYIESLFCDLRCK